MCSYIITKGKYENDDCKMTYHTLTGASTKEECCKKIYKDILKGIKHQVELAKEQEFDLDVLPLYEFFPIVGYRIWKDDDDNGTLSPDEEFMSEIMQEPVDAIESIDGNLLCSLDGYWYDETVPFWMDYIEELTGRQIKMKTVNIYSFYK